MTKMRFPALHEFFVPAVEAGLMVAEAQAVIAMRLAGMAGLWPVAPQEGLLMLAEKVAAGQDATMAALGAGLRGASAPEVALAAMQPYRQRTQANARRLMGG
jgi:hypothetical protein